jgi:hypothetical protein
VGFTSNSLHNFLDGTLTSLFIVEKNREAISDSTITAVLGLVNSENHEIQFHAGQTLRNIAFDAKNSSAYVSFIQPAIRLLCSPNPRVIQSGLLSLINIACDGRFKIENWLFSNFN